MVDEFGVAAAVAGPAAALPSCPQSTLCMHAQHHAGKVGRPAADKDEALAGSREQTSDPSASLEKNNWRDRSAGLKHNENSTVNPFGDKQVSVKAFCPEDHPDRLF